MSLASVKEALASAGIIWPLPSKEADAPFTMLYSSLKLGWDALLRFHVVRNPRAMTAQQAYFEFIRNQFATGNSTIIGNAVTYNQMWDIAAPAMNALLPFFGSSEPTPKPAEWFANSSSAGLSEGRWIETLRRVNVSVNDSLRILSYDRAFLQKLLTLWESYGEDQFHLFVSWCTVQVAALYANRGLILNYYGKVPDKAMLYYRAFCVSKALFFSPSLIAKHSVLLNSTRQVIELSYAVRHLWLYSTSWGKRDFNLMPYTLSFPFFDSKLPTSVNFGGFGSEVVDALGSILVGTYRAYSNATDSLFKCLRRGPSGEDEYPEEYVTNAIGYSALVDAFRQSPLTSWVLEGLEQYSGMQLLFISSCFHPMTIGRLRDFIADSGVPGCDVLCGKRGGGFRKAVWAIVLATLLSLTLQECIQVFLEYGRFPVSFDYSYEEEDSLHFPAVTVCNVNPLKKAALCTSELASSQEMPEQLHRRLCGNDTIFYKPNPEDTATQMQLTAWMAQLSSSRYQRLETLTTQFEDMIVSCSYGRRNCTHRK
ncbi:hypothetical protein MRX96_040380 [Rhipicephalus microplus]